MRLLLSVIALAVALGFNAFTHAGSLYKKNQEIADKHFLEGNYKEAEKRYKNLGRVGDKYAQYRLSRIYLDGLAGRKSLSEAYAWANLAAKNKHPGLVAFRDQIWESIPPAQRQSARKKADRFEGLYSDIAIARKVERASRQRLRSCTGSRLGTSCESVYAASMPRAVGMAPDGVFADSGIESTTASAQIGTGSESGGTSGGEIRNVEYYQGLRETIASLEAYIAAHEQGQVELGELKVIEDENDKPKEADEKS